ncbi:MULTISPECIES: SgcJ/EcaC family oxidoreductase [unclassified Streptomyces]|uniref:SgcJ/EcaC family oxidoreductase n=1 Tax=unclassified Streptomyces TaxID=2593676 RepID=UPI002E37988B|nr:MULTISPECIES: SgcJ/EcaC family oxidoreductase [unclassified Streptomyces]WUC68380.1 SgcJ/EcaC family oxidoreductase [Streptomyces sp. NBC_00539]
MKPPVAGVTISQEEVRAVVSLVAQVEHAQRNGLPDAFAELFRQDAFWTMPYGDPLTGLEEISAFAHRALPSASRQPVTVTYGAAPSCSSGPTSP